MDGRHSCEQSQRCNEGRDVREPDDPGRLHFAQLVPAEQGNQVDRGLSAPRRHDGPDGGVGQHRHQFTRAVGGRSTDMPGAVDALPDDDLVSPGLYVTDGDVQPLAQFLPDSARRSGNTDTVTGAQRARESN
ncbi:hypothetical protein SHKM778_48010 [Streptomyces sp. KM77-8]|uniref:Uncharacterized protein n=1 Tax=Streptomyces haneummycinicus TaxID=3074435 RepID=A0AAT9HMQ7_9ACTN